MKYPLLYHAVYCEPLCVDRDVFRSIHATLWPRITMGQGMDLGEARAAEKPVTNPGTGRRMTKARPMIDYDTGRVMDPRFYSTVEGRPEIAVIPVYGILAKNATMIEEACQGVTDINGIQHAIAQAAAAKEVKTLILDLATPGGQVTGIPEISALVRSVTQMRGKTVYAFTDERCCSAGYWIGSQADEFYATPSSTVGSIGTYLAWLDESVKMQLEGVRLEFFGAGKHKGMGLPGRPLSQEDRALLQSKVEEINGWFTSAVSMTRKKVSEETMQGQTFGGAEAVARHLADGVVGSWEEFLTLV
jgi:signal peptide peptidase SppA